MRRAAAGEQGELRVGVLASVANHLMPPLVRAFGERHPGIALLPEDVTVAAMVKGCARARSTPAWAARRWSTTSSPR